MLRCLRLYLQSMHRMLTRELARRKASRIGHRSFTSRVLPSAAYTNSQGAQHISTSSTPRDITKGQRDALDAALRIDQAGEVAANWIYMGQLAVLGRDRVVGPLIQVS